MTPVSKILVVLAAAGLMTSCSSQPSGSAAPEATKGGATGTFICFMGADCGKADVAAGQQVPSCCGKTMVKAANFSCACGKTKIADAAKPAPECCGKAMSKSAN